MEFLNLEEKDYMKIHLDRLASEEFKTWLNTMVEKNPSYISSVTNIIIPKENNTDDHETMKKNKRIITEHLLLIFYYMSRKNKRGETK